MASSPLYGFGPLWGRGSSSTWGQGFLLQVQRKSREGRAVVMVALCVSRAAAARRSHGGGVRALFCGSSCDSHAAVALSALPGSLASAGAALLRTFATLKRWFCPESKALHLGAVAGNASETQKERVHGAA